MFKRKILSFVALTLLIVFSTVSANAQVTPRLHQPPPNRLNVEDLWKIDLTNNTGKTLSVKLRGTATEATQGIVFEGTSSVFKLKPGFTPISLPDIEPLDVSWANEEVKTIVTQTGSVPAGSYQVCIFVLDAETEKELGRDCIQQQVAHPTPPQLISPADGANVTEEHPVFTWMPPVPTPPGQQISYEVKIVEILDNQSPTDAIQSNPAWFEEKGISTTSFQYPTSARKFEPGRRYGWQVTYFIRPNIALSAVMRLYTKMIEGLKSEVWSFRYKEKLPREQYVSITRPSEGDTLGSVEYIEVDVGDRKDIKEISFYISWDGKKWELLGIDKNPENGWGLEIDTYALILSGTREGYVKVIAKTEKGKALESKPSRIVIVN